LNTNISNSTSRPSLTEDETREKHAISSAFSAVGIDTVVLQTPVDREMRARLVHEDVTNRWIRVKVPLRGVRLTYGWGRAVVVADLPLVAGCATNEHPVEPEFAGELAQTALGAALDSETLTYKGENVTPDSFTFTRVDVVRDFVEVNELDEILDVVQREVRRDGVELHRRSNGSSLAVKHKGWRATLYDKHAKRNSAAPPGAVRFELNLRTRRLCSEWARDRGGNWRRPGDITRESAYRMARDTFVDEVHFHSLGRPVSQILSTIKALTAKPLQQATLLGLAYEPSLIRQLQRSSRTKYSALMREIGSVADYGQTASYLDFESGRQLTWIEEA
jgi:hypothetical protein